LLPFFSSMSVTSPICKIYSLLYYTHTILPQCLSNQTKYCNPSLIHTYRLILNSFNKPPSSYWHFYISQYNCRPPSYGRCCPPLENDCRFDSCNSHFLLTASDVITWLSWMSLCHLLRAFACQIMVVKRQEKLHIS
jgi:hypothetical protein